MVSRCYKRGVARTLIVGDVHGCRPELESLLERAGVTADDRVVCVGDLVARGPDTPGVLRVLASLGAQSVMGNHDRRLVEVWHARQRGERGPLLGPAHERALSELSDQDLAALAALPLWLDLPQHDVRVVHAGVVPGVPIEEQAPDDLLLMRTLLEDGTPSKKRDGVPWGARYDEQPHVVFGHNAVDGLQLHPHATGIDTGCVYGGELTALVLPQGSRVPPPESRRDLLLSVPARAQYATY